jgi:acetyl-CoA acetyltransferase
VNDTWADLAKIDVNGGAIGFGHPLGASGARIMTTRGECSQQRGGRHHRLSGAATTQAITTKQCVLETS